MDTPDILFQYLKDIVYRTEKASLDIDALQPEYRKLGQALELIGKWLADTKKFSMAIAEGDLSYNLQDKENVFLGPLKELQATLRHLAWQTEQVAKGDYSQKVDFMGDFSVAFNTMTKQLQERRDALIAEKERMEEKNLELERTFGLAMEFADHNQNMVLIYSLDGQGELFRNEAAGEFLKACPEIGNVILEKLSQKNEERAEEADTWEFEACSVEDSQKCIYFIVETYPIQWRQQNALVHVVSDDTKRKVKEEQMFHFAYVDLLTGLYNKRYAMEKMERWVREKVPFVLSFIDLDYLKYCNDTYGHSAGDAYLIKAAEALKKLGGVLCRAGGDEFILLRVGKTAKEQNRALEEVRRNLGGDSKQCPCPKSFSYASCEVPVNPEKALEEYIALADERMYEYKTRYRRPLEDVWYKDNRTGGTYSVKS